METTDSILNDLKRGQLVRIILLDRREIVGHIEAIEVSRNINEDDVRLTIRLENGSIIYVFLKRVKSIEIIEQ